MANVYEAKTSAGNYNVTTDKHHSNHDDATFKRHLLDVIKATASGVTTGVILHEYKLIRRG